ncbi:MAG: hypothetical protein PVJ43_09185 [Gemmatimonadales bacterium]
MIPDPLHPALVHFPIVFTFILPVIALGALWMIRRGTPPRRAWAPVVVVTGLLAASSWLAVQTGGAQEDRVEGVVAERPLENHEESGERFLLLSVVGLGVMGAGFLRGRAGRVGRWAGAVAAGVLLLAGWQVGHTGGELAYRHGAAAVYHQSTAVGARSPDGDHDGADHDTREEEPAN